MAGRLYNKEQLLILDKLTLFRKSWRNVNHHFSSLYFGFLNKLNANTKLKTLLTGSGVFLHPI